MSSDAMLAAGRRSQGRLVRALTIACWAFATVGVAVAVLGTTPIFAVWTRALAPVFFGAAELPGPARRLAAFVFGPLGGSIAGKWVLAALIAQHALARGERWALRAEVAGLAAWFVVDSVVSLALGAWANVILINVAPLVCVGVPLALLRGAPAPAPAHAPASPPTFWDRWLVVACALQALLGLLLAVLGTAVLPPVAAAIEEGFIAGSAAPADLRAFLRFLCGPLGATILGQMVLMTAVAAGPFRRGEPWAARGLAASLAAWFVLDSTVSLATGAWWNVLLVNLPSATLVALPLVALRRRFAPAATRGA